MIRTGENRSTRGKIDPSATVFTSNSIYTGLGWNPGLRGESLATNRVSRGTAIKNYRLNTKKGGFYTMYKLQLRFFLPVSFSP
jgi:hypothetical protein